MRVRRDIASIPLRTAGETWQVIIDLITGSGSVDTVTLKAAASVMESLIADEHPATVPIVVKAAKGPRLVIYCIYNEAAMEVGKAVDPLNWNPTEGDWRITAPCETDDVTWMNTTLKTRAPRIRVHDVATPPANEEELKKSDASVEALAINWGVLDHP